MTKKIFLILLVVGLVGIFPGCGLVDDSFDTKTWNWEPLWFEEERGLNYSLKAELKTETIKSGEMSFGVADLGGDVLILQVSGNFGGEGFSAMTFAFFDEQDNPIFSLWDILFEIGEQVGKENFELLEGIFDFFWFYHTFGVIAQDKTLHVGFMDEFILFSEDDPEKIILSRTINIPGIKKHRGEQGYIVDIVLSSEKNENTITIICNFLISFKGPILLTGKQFFYLEGEVAKILSMELKSFSY